MLAPTRDGYAPSDQSLLRKTSGDQSIDNQNSDNSKKDTKAPSRIGAPPTYGIPAASGASDSGFDSLNRTRKKPKPFPGTPKPKIVGPGNPPPSTEKKLNGKVVAPISASVAGIAAGQPRRRALKPDDDPFGNVGFHTGSFLTKAAVEIWGGYNSNPGRIEPPRASSFYTISPELLSKSEWSRHSLTIDLRGSFTGYDTKFPPTVDCNCNPPSTIPSPVPTSIDTPSFDGKIKGRLDAYSDMRFNSELRMRVFTDNPGSPNIQVGLSKYPLATQVGTTVGVERDFNRLQVSVSGLADRTTYQDSKLTDGTSSTNDDRNFNQFGGVARASYDLTPGVKPFVEVEGDSRTHDMLFDRSGYQRNSNGGYVKAGTTFEFSRLLTGEVGAGYSTRSYADPRLDRLSGLLTSASLIWTASGLTTVRFDATSSIDETTLAGVSGSKSNDYSLTVDHAFRRWLIGTAKFGYGTTDYGISRFDNRYFVEGDLVYKLSRTFHIKAQVRHDWLESSLGGANSDATVVMLGLRIQR
ncbi:MAG: outer membrane beta-barrel protein [Afipia sp.]|nr:outer membrane beta-barrel protein [Afipia sp.]